MYTYTYMCIYIYIYTHTYTCIHTYTETNSRDNRAVRARHVRSTRRRVDSAGRQAYPGT